MQFAVGFGFECPAWAKKNKSPKRQLRAFNKSLLKKIRKLRTNYLFLYHVFRMFARPQDISNMLLRQICCSWCGCTFCVCLSCWRGQSYCSDECSIAGRRHVHREAQRRYRQTHKGKCAHREAERRRRKRGAKKNVADRGSTPLSTGCNIPPLSARSTGEGKGFDEPGREGCCHFCGCWGTIVDRFARRGYGRKYREPKVSRKCDADT